MIEIKKTTFLLALVVLLTLGLLIGYLIGSSKDPVLKTLYINKQTDIVNTENIQTKRKVEKLDLTAQEAVDIAFFDALSWSQESYLSEIRLDSKSFNDTGTSNGWVVEFYSKEKEMIFVVVFKDGETRGGQ